MKSTNLHKLEATGASVVKATSVDAEEIRAVIDIFARDGVVLKRSISEIYDHLRDFFVYKANGVIAGVCSLHIWGPELGEIRSLAVMKKYESSGVGRGLNPGKMSH